VSKLIAFLFSYSPRMIIMAIITSVIAGLANSALLALIHQALSDFEEVDMKLVGYFIAMGLLLPLMSVASSILLTVLSQDSVFDLRLHLSRRILAAPLRELEQQGGNKLLTALTNDIMAITAALSQFASFVMNGAIVASCVGYLLWLYWPAGVGVFVASLMGVGIFFLVRNKAQKGFDRARVEADDMYYHYKALTDGTKELKIHRERRESFITGPLFETAASYRGNIIEGSAYYAVASSIAQLLFFVSIGLCVFLLPSLVPDVPAATVTGYTLILLFMIGPLNGITAIIPALAKAVISLKKIEDLGISLENITTEEISHADPPRSFELLEFDAITHTFHREKEDQSFTLGPISLSFTPGEMVFLVGGNGSGKTTLAKLITGLYTPESGSVRVDGQTVTDVTRDQLRQYFSVIFTDFYLFDTFLGIEEATVLEKAEEYLEQLQLDHKVKIVDGRLDTLDLSQGQRKRLSLLTAYLEDRPLYLFDEWAADQDPLFKSFFYLTLLPELKSRGKTLIVISHDDHYYHVADRIIKLDYGQLEFDLPREEALAQNHADFVQIADKSPHRQYRR